jgi:hypothetical protein
MLNPKIKGLYVDISEFSVLAARTNGYKLPLVIEELAEYPLISDDGPEELREFFEQIVDFKGGKYFVSRAGVYPEGRFVRYYEAESVSKAKDLNWLSQVLKSELNIDADSNRVSIIDARDGSDIVLETSLSKHLIFCGGPIDRLQAQQDYLLECGIYPERMELSTVSTLGGVGDYSKFHGIKSPLLCFELTSTSANIFILNQGQVEVTRPVPFGLDSIYPLLQRELGLKDEASARKLFFSNTFDFAEMGPKLLRRMTKELQATTGFYEVQTGLTIENVFISVLPKNLAWVARTVSESLGLEVIQPNLEKWLESLKIKLGEGVEVSNLGSRWMGLFSLMGEFQLKEDGDSE